MAIPKVLLAGCPMLFQIPKIDRNSGGSGIAARISADSASTSAVVVSKVCPC